MLLLLLLLQIVSGGPPIAAIRQITIITLPTGEELARCIEEQAPKALSWKVIPQTAKQRREMNDRVRAPGVKSASDFGVLRVGVNTQANYVEVALLDQRQEVVLGAWRSEWEGIPSCQTATAILAQIAKARR